MRAPYSVFIVDKMAADWHQTMFTKRSSALLGGIDRVRG